MRKSILKVVAAVMFAFLLSFNVTTSMNGDNFSLEGFTALVVGSTGDDDDEGNLSCADITGCATQRACGTDGTVNGCSLDCNDEDPFPLNCPYGN